MASNNSKKERDEVIAGIVSVGEDGWLQINYDTKTASVEIDTLKNVRFERTYERPKGPKVLSRIPLDDRKSFSSAKSLWDNFDILCAIDTNTRPVRGKKVSVTGIVLYEKEPISNTGKLNWRFHVPFCMETIEIIGKEENAAWSLALQYLEQRGLIARTCRVGAIVDSDLGNLNAYNSRDEKFDGLNLLPANYKFIYGSADVGDSDLVNHAIRNADKTANIILGHLISGTIALASVGGNPPYFEAHRLIFSKRPSG